MQFFLLLISICLDSRKVNSYICISQNSKKQKIPLLAVLKRRKTKLSIDYDEICRNLSLDIDNAKFICSE